MTQRSYIPISGRPRFHALLLVTGTVLALVFWQSPVLYPVKLFVVFMHELSHALAALATGGEVLRIDIGSDLGGAAFTRGGWEPLVVSAGYLGSMLIGNALLLLSMRRQRARVLSAAVGAVVLLVTLLYIRNAFGAVFGSLFGVAMIAGARYLPASWMSAVLQLLGILSSLYALFDVREDLLTLEHRVTDASILAGMTGIPAIVWGVLWSAAALLLLLLTFRTALRRFNTESHQHTLHKPEGS
jgi:hypothetical protein